MLTALSCQSYGIVTVDGSYVREHRFIGWINGVLGTQYTDWRSTQLWEIEKLLHKDGCEEYNKDFFLRTGGAVTGQTPREIARTSLKLLSNEPALKKMGDALGAAVPQNAAANILSEMSAAEEEGDLA